MPAMRSHPSEGDGTNEEQNMKMDMKTIKKAVKDQGDRIMADTGRPLAGTDLGRTLDAMASILFNLFGEEKTEYLGPCHECGNTLKGQYYWSPKRHSYCFDCAHMFEDKTKPYPEWLSTKRAVMQDGEITKHFKKFLSERSNVSAEEALKEIRRLDREAK